MTQRLQELIRGGENLSLKAYYDSKKILTIGIGRNIEKNGLSQEEIIFGNLKEEQLANMEELVITPELALFMFNNDIEECMSSLKQYFWFNHLDDVRKDILIDMCFNMGLTSLLKFVEFKKALSVKDYNKAAAEMIDSVWYGEVKSRARIRVSMMRLGRYLTKQELSKIYQSYR